MKFYSHFYKFFSLWNKKNKVPNNFIFISFIDRTHNMAVQRELKLDGAKGDFADPL